MKSSTALQMALYRDASKRAAQWAREKNRQLAARFEPEAPAPRWGVALLAVIILTGVMTVAALVL